MTFPGWSIRHGIASMCSPRPGRAGSGAGASGSPAAWIGKGAEQAGSESDAGEAGRGGLVAGTALVAGRGWRPSTGYGWASPKTTRVAEGPGQRGRRVQERDRSGHESAPRANPAVPMRMCLDGADVGRLRALRPLRDVELHALVVLQAAEAVGRDRGEVREDVLAAVVRRDEAETLVGVEPFDRTGGHRSPL